MFDDISRIREGKSARASSWDRSGRNSDYVMIAPGETKVLADIQAAGSITRIWMAQRGGYRECLLRISWDGSKHPSVLCPLGDFFCLGNGFINSFQSAYFSASTKANHAYGGACALNCHFPMPFRERALVELVNEGPKEQKQWYHIDYETYEQGPSADRGFFHAEFRRENPFGGWGPEIAVNSPEADAVNTERDAWDHNYLILNATGRGHYVGCNLSVTNFNGGWWGEGDDMIWVDGYDWPPELHGTGSEDYFGHAFGMQPNAFLRNGSSLHESLTGGYQTSYVFHLENPVRFLKEIRVTIECGHANHLANEVSSTAYWYAEKPDAAAKVPSLARRMPVLRDNAGHWLHDRKSIHTSWIVKPTAAMAALKKKWAEKSHNG